ncbi:MAG: hypothetical protein HQL70_04695 [Magnetococcales bacterium]|nr:hypothetical protein [Magnetococcales bacterium]
MSSDTVAAKPAISFSERLKGRFNGMVRLADAWHLAAAVVEYNDWYMVDPTCQEQACRVSGADVGCHLEELLEEILREEKGVWSTMVYVQDITDPQIIKIYHPRRAGCGCGGQGGIVPWWVLTRVEPEIVPEWQQESCGVDSLDSAGGGLSWLKKIF